MELLDKTIPDFSKYLTLEKLINYDSYMGLVSEDSFNSNATSFIASLLPFYLKSNFNVIFIACNESLIHYTAIARKYGVNIVNNQNFYFIDSFYSPYKAIIKEELPLSEQFPYTFNCIKSKNYYQAGNFFDIPCILEKITSQIENKEKTILLIDNISSISIDNLQDYINSIYQVCISKNVCLLIGLNKSLLNNNFDYSYMEHLSDLEFEFLDNESGFSKDIDGKLRISVN